MQKDYNIMYNVGNCKYIVNYHDGVKTHKDGSKFYDIALFSNKQKMNNFIKELQNQGYKDRLFKMEFNVVNDYGVSANLDESVDCRMVLLIGTL